MSKKPKSAEGKKPKKKSGKKSELEIKDLPRDVELDDDELDSVSGGTSFRTTTDEPSQIIRQPPSPPRIGYPDK